MRRGKGEEHGKTRRKLHSIQDHLRRTGPAGGHPHAGPRQASDGGAQGGRRAGGGGGDGQVPVGAGQAALYPGAVCVRRRYGPRDEGADALGGTVRRRLHGRGGAHRH